MWNKAIQYREQNHSETLCCEGQELHKYILTIGVLNGLLSSGCDLLEARESFYETQRYHERRGHGINRNNYQKYPS